MMKITRLLQKYHFLYIDFAHNHALWSLGTLGSVNPFHRFQMGSTGLFSYINILYSYIYSCIYCAHSRAHSIVHSIIHSTYTQLIIYVIKVVINYCKNILDYNPIIRHIKITYINSAIFRYYYSIVYTILDFFRWAIDKSNQICYCIYMDRKK